MASAIATSRCSKVQPRSGRTWPQKTPANATAQCKDGSYSTAKTERGACSKHGGVKTWYGAAGTAVAPPAAKTPAAERRTVKHPRPARPYRRRRHPPRPHLVVRPPKDRRRGSERHDRSVYGWQLHASEDTERRVLQSRRSQELVCRCSGVSRAGAECCTAAQRAAVTATRRSAARRASSRRTARALGVVCSQGSVEPSVARHACVGTLEDRYTAILRYDQNHRSDKGTSQTKG